MELIFKFCIFLPIIQLIFLIMALIYQNIKLIYYLTPIFYSLPFASSGFVFIIAKVFVSAGYLSTNGITTLSNSIRPLPGSELVTCMSCFSDNPSLSAKICWSLAFWFSKYTKSLFPKMPSISSDFRKSPTFCVSPVGIPPHFRNLFHISTE